MPALPDRKPWLRNKAWASRRIRSQSSISWWVQIFTLLIFGGIVLIGFVNVLLTAKQPSERIEVFIMAGILLCIGTGLVYLWLQHRRYGESVCMLVTLPGVIGGWLKADIECKLPLDTAEPIVIRLMNIAGLGKSSSMLWQAEYTLAPGSIQMQPAERVVVPLRLKIPRDPEQLPSSAPGTFAKPVFWTLEISRATKGVNFIADFEIPIFDTREAPPAEQLPEEQTMAPAPVPGKFPSGALR